ncbi:MAG: hypothetical protein PVF96_03240 [Candidatus Bathyarchaeota archaeon]|jgi:hypothetical protein
MALERISLGAVLAVAMTTVVVGVLASTLLSSYQRVPNFGDVRAVGVGVYWNRECTDNVTSIDWGYVEPGTSANVTVYVKNEGTIPVVLTMDLEEWDPTSAQTYLDVSWNRENRVLETGYTSAVITLSVSPEVNGFSSFTFDIVIKGTEYTIP